ncbi:MAG TPA: DUF1080 domain-containing protein [Candidatus Glassbacteria bacterium]|nr:DUF1080 domain-containing protein [Candidatus Glassbacteria bacterium]
MHRNLILAITTTACLAFLACGEKAPLEKDFQPLFNGRDLEGWETATGFRVKNGCILSDEEGAGNLFTARDYGNYILRLDYMLSEVGNSGVVIRADPDSAWQTGFEVQLLAPWTPFRDDLHCTGSIYGYVAVTNRPDETTGRWHSLEVVCDRKTIIVSVDGQACSWANMDQVESLQGKALSGRIGLQGNHSDPQEWVRFRNLRLRELDLDPDYVVQGLRSTDPRLRHQAHAAAVSLQAAAIDPLCRLLASPDSVGPSAARQALFAIAAEASEPDADTLYKKAVRQALATAADSAGVKTVRAYLNWLDGMLAGGN